MVQKNELSAEYRVGPRNYQTFMFKVDSTQSGFQVTINANVLESGLDIIYVLFSYADYKKWQEWMAHGYQNKIDTSGNVVKDASGYPIILRKPEPATHKIINRRTNILEKTLSLGEEAYVLMFDNTYSTINSKSIWLRIIEEWNRATPTANLPIVEQLLDEVPDDVATCITDANNCYTAGHYNQCSVMLRKAVEIAIKIKLQQSDINTDEMFDKAGNELNLAGKMKLLRKHKLITQRTMSDLDQIKWFGDIGAHATMRVTTQDIKDNVEPKIRSFLAGLNLKV